jgi:hypothetical protein
MSTTNPRSCSQGRDHGPGTLSCSHTGDKVEHDNVVVFMARSYGMWGWKIMEAVAPGPVSTRLKRHRKKRKKAKAKRHAAL